MASFRKVLRIGIVSIVGIGIIVLLVTFFANFSEGFRVGVPIKFSKKGVIFKTYEGQLNLGSLNQESTGNFSTYWDFSVKASADSVVNKLDSAIVEGYRVKLFYKEKFVQVPWRGDTKYMVYDVEYLRKN